MDKEEYISKLTEKLKPEFVWMNKKIDNFSVSVGINNKPKTGYRFLWRIYINLEDEMKTIDDFNFFCGTMQQYSLRYLKSWWDVLITTPVLVSENGFSKNLKQHIYSSRFIQFGHACMPVLIDLKNGEIISLQKYGLLGRGPTKKAAQINQKLFSIDDLITPPD